MPERRLSDIDVEAELKRRDLEDNLARQVDGGRLALAVTDNEYTMISVRRDKGLFRIRLHHMFLSAEPNVVEALGAYVAHNDRSASRLLGRFIEVNHQKIKLKRRARRATQALFPKGELYDLDEIYVGLNQRYFGGAIDARITWGKRRPEGKRPRRRRSIKMGSYSVEEKLIRIHPSLDRAFVPRQFLEWIVYHEMLHQKHAIPFVDGRHRYHTPEFLAEEAAFESAAAWRRWELEHLDELLTY
jgi:hypothetical protein